MDSDKEAPAYGPWLLVSYGKQGNRINKGRVGRNGSGSQNSSENNGSLGKILGSGSASARRTDGGGYGNSSSIVKVSSRFDILSDEGDVDMVEGSTQNSKAEEGRKINAAATTSKSMETDSGCPSLPLEPVSNDLDNANAPRHIHSEVINLEAQLAKSKSRENTANMDSFEFAASELKEVLAVISE
ncbi:hypothetical protein Q3G72_009781 [Acer saccharum]|nr:hypothetical protein Q3G72_009781 [Acer saccharum]